MIRVLATIILPLLAPTVVYFVYVVLSNRRARRSTGPAVEIIGGDTDQSGRAIRTAPWPWLAGIGVVLTALSLVLFSEFERSPPGGIYAPPRLIDGEIVPAETGPPPAGDAPAETEPPPTGDAPAETGAPPTGDAPAEIAE